MSDLKNIKNEELGLSDCCGQDVLVNYGDEGTNCYLCKKCLQPCDIVIKGMIYNYEELPKTDEKLNIPKLQELAKKVKNDEEEEKEFDKIVYVGLSEKEINERIGYVCNGNMQAKLDIIMHNQFIINEKLNKLLDKNEKFNSKIE